MAVAAASPLGQDEGEQPTVAMEVFPDGTTPQTTQNRADGGQALQETQAETMADDKSAADPPVLLPTALDGSSWPIVHGTKQSLDSSPDHQPITPQLNLFNSQTPSSEESGWSRIMTAFSTTGTKDAGTENASVRLSAVLNVNVADANPVSIITQKIDEHTQILWTSAVTNVIAYRQRDESPLLERLAEFDHGLNLRFHGSYAFVGTTNGRSGFFTTDDIAIIRYELQGNDQDGWEIIQTGSVSLPSWANPDEDDHLVGITLLDDGTVVVGSKNGVLLAAAVDSVGGLYYRDAMVLGPHLQTSNTHVSNSISSQGQAVFVVTQREMVRADFDPDTSRFVFRWSDVYGAEEGWYIGRLGPGAGSTPTVTMCEGRSLVTITDGALPMNLRWYDTETGVLVAARRVQFGGSEEGSVPTTSEQSVAVEGCKAFVVQNFMGTDTLSEDTMCTLADPGTFRHSMVSSFCSKASISSGSATPGNPDLFVARTCPVGLGCMAMGAALYEVQPGVTDGATGRAAVRRIWTREDLSCGTSIPLISTHPDSHVVYCVGAKKGSSRWALLGMDMATGRDALTYEFYPIQEQSDKGLLNFVSNPFYAGVEAVGHDKVAIGSIGGILYLSPSDPSQKPQRYGGNSASAPRVLLESLSISITGSESSMAKLLAAPIEVTAGVGAAFFVVVAAVLFVLIRSTRRVLSPRLPTAINT